MKKFALIAMIGLVASSVAFAASLSVPFFNDRAGEDGNLRPADASGSFTGAAAYVGLKNQTNAPIVITLQYFQGGTEYTPTANTWEIPANDTITFRPWATDAITENIWSAVPDMVNIDNLSQQIFGIGALTVSWIGESTDVQGRVLEFWQNAFGGGNDAYLLPAGA